MRGNLLGILFSILSGVLIFLIAVAYSRSDRVAPEFRFSATDTVYDSKTTDSDLMVGVNAYDAKDGDMSGRIVVEKVVLNREKETAVVYYAVADHSGNVTKQSRVFPADIKDIDRSGDESQVLEDEMFPNLGVSVQEIQPEEGESSENSSSEEASAATSE